MVTVKISLNHWLNHSDYHEWYSLNQNITLTIPIKKLSKRRFKEFQRVSKSFKEFQFENLSKSFKEFQRVSKEFQGFRFSSGLLFFRHML
jgi:hypothetical protein